MSDDYTESPQAALKTLREALKRALASRAAHDEKLVRAEAFFPEIDLLAWLQAQDSETKIFWADREQAFSAAGAGAAVEIHSDSPQELRQIFTAMTATLSPAYPNLRYYGGFRFDDAIARDPRWKPFGTYRFVVPEIEVGKKGNQYYIACNIAPGSEADEPERVKALLRKLEGIVFPADALETAMPPVTSREDRPNEAAWTVQIQAALKAFEGGALDKVVLGRESLFKFEEDLDPMVLLQHLVANTMYSYHFCFQPEARHAFVGASPERLFRRHNVYLQSEALAGTRPRGNTPEEDEELGKELLQSDKELREHRFVATNIRRIFDQHCRAIRGGDQVELLKLRHVQHLLSRVEGMLNTPDCDGELLRTLHPTPAIGGVPTENALDLIRETEPFDRGWWAGPLGWVGYDATEFAVAIRSGLISGNTLSLYSGAGIVPGSEPAEEWREIENKMANFLSVLEEV